MAEIQGVTFDENDNCTECGNARRTSHVLVSDFTKGDFYTCMFPKPGSGRPAIAETIAKAIAKAEGATYVGGDDDQETDGDDDEGEDSSRGEDRS